jgi:hypothetical protein
VRVLASKVNFLIVIFKKSAISNTKSFFDFAKNLIRNFFKSLGKIFALKLKLIKLIISQTKSITIRVNAYNAAVSTRIVYNIGALLHVRLGLLEDDCASRLDLAPCVN